MVNASTSPTIEAFLTDDAFANKANSLLNFFQEGTGQIASLNTKVLSYFNTPFIWEDKRAYQNRSVNWAANTLPKLLIDQAQFTLFVQTAGALSTDASAGVFSIIDELLFHYSPNRTKSDIETLLTSDSKSGPIYVPDTYQTSSVIVTDTVYIGNTTQQVNVPAWAEFSLTLPQGSSTTTVVMRVYASVDQWLSNYSVSTITKIIPPLPYDKILTASLTNTSDNIFSTASLSASLNYSTTQSLLGATSVSGVVKYMATITDGINTVQLPFNILYKGRSPTMYEIRQAMRQALLDSGVGDEKRWKARIPGVFISGRFYILPIWDNTLTKPDQVIYPTLIKYKTLENVTERVLGSLGYGDLVTYMDVLQVYYDHITATVIPDLSGIVDIVHLAEFIPDYQDHSPTSEQFQYMAARTQSFARELNKILSISSGQATDPNYITNKEGLLEFYSFTVDSYEVCVISKQCYQSIMEATQ